MVRNIDLIFQTTTQIPISLGSDLLKIESISGSYLLTYLLIIIITYFDNYYCSYQLFMWLKVNEIFFNNQITHFKNVYTVFLIGEEPNE